MKSSRWQKVLNHFSGLLFAFIFVNAISAFAGPGRTTYQAKIVKPDGYPLEAASVNFKFTILDPAGSCVLYSETYSSVNMSGTGGLISFSLGSGVKTYPTSTTTTFEQVFSNITPNIPCDVGGPTDYTPAASDIRKIVMQFHDGAGWQTLPAMNINAVPYAMYANEAAKLNGKSVADFVQFAGLPSCAAGEALKYNGVSFSCVAMSSGVTSSAVTTALGYTPADGASVTTLTSNISSVSSTVFSVSSTVTSLQSSVAASFAAITSSQWTTSGTVVFYNSGSVGIGTTTPVTKLDVSGGVRIGAESTTCAPALAGTLRYNASNVEYCNGTSWQAFGVSGAGINNFNGSTSGTQSFATGTGGTAPAFNTSNGVHTLNIPLASAGSVTAGLISNADYTTFSNKITSSAASIAQVLGYTPANSATVSALQSDLSSVSATANNALVKSNNLSDLTNIATARTNLGLGTFATASSIDLGSASATGILAIARLPSFTGDATIAAASNTIILSNSGVTAGAYTKVVVDSKGRVTSGSQITSSDVTTALGYTPGNSTSGVTSLNGSTSQTQTLANATGGTAPNFNTSNGVHTLNIPYASVGTTTAGLISNTDYVNFSNKITSSAAAIAQVLGYTPANSATTVSSQWITSATNIYYNTGNVGIGTTTPVTKLDVSGGVRIGAESTTCAPALAGTLRYNAGNVEYCNGTTWSAFGVATSGLTSLNGATSQTQSFANATGGTTPNIVTANGVHTLNIPLASTGSVTAGLISNSDYTTFSNKITSSAASIAQVLGYVPADNAASGMYAQKANNLSDLTNIATARTNLGLGTFATASSIDLGSASATGTLAIARLPSFTGDATIAAASNTIILSNSGVTAGTYTKVTVDAKGRVTSSSALASSDVTTALGYTPASATASTQWTTSGSAIYYNTGNVGIGTAAPGTALDVLGIISSRSSNTWGSGANSTFKAVDPNGLLFSLGLDAGNTKLELNTQYSTMPIVFSVGNSEKMRVDSAGIVGIGTTNPSYGLLDVNGGARFTVGTTNFLVDGTAASMFRSNSSGAGGANIDLLHYNNGSGILANAVTGAVNFKGSNSSGVFTMVAQLSSRMPTVSAGSEAGTLVLSTMDNGLMSDRINIIGGNVGIGTATPSAKLHLAAGTSSTASFKFTSGTLLTSPQSGAMEYDGSYYYLTDGSNTRRTIATGSSAGTIDNANNINSSGNITLTPAGSVIVSSTTASTDSQTGALVVKGGVGIAGTTNIAQNLNVSGSSVIDGSLKLSSMTSGSILFAGANGTVTQDNSNFYWDSINKRLGIGTSAPVQKLHADSGTTSGTYVAFTNNDSGSTMSDGFHIGIGDLEDAIILNRENTPMRFFTNNSEKMRIDNNGNVGIGISAPSTTLEVSGTAQISAGSDGVNSFNTHTRIARSSMVMGTPSSVNAIAESVVGSLGFLGYGQSHGQMAYISSSSNGRFEFKNVSAGGPSLNINDVNTYPYANVVLGRLGFGTSNTVTMLSNTNVNHGDSSGIGGHTSRSISWEASNQGYVAALANTDATATSRNGLLVKTAATDTGSYIARFESGGSNKMTVRSDGNVGIGTTNPSAKLEVAGTSVFSTTTDTGISLSLRNLANSNNWNIYNLPSTDGNSPNALLFENCNGGCTRKMTIAQSGNIGIGTATPGAKLDVNGNAQFEGNILLNAAGPTLTFNSGGSWLYGGANTLYMGTGNTPGSANAQMTILNSGNVGIGTTSPGSALSIKSSTANNTTGDGFTNLRLEYAGGYNAGDIGAGVTFAQQYVAPGTDAAAIRVGGIFGVKTQATGNFGGGLAFFRQPAGAANMSEAMRIDQNGNVGIGTTAPGDKLQVSGAIIVGAQSGATDDNTDYYIKSNGQLHIQANQSGSADPSYVHVVIDAGTASSTNSAIVMNTKGVERMKISDAGQVTTPSQTFFEAKLCSAVVNPGGTMIWETVITNIGNAYSASTGKFTAPVAGVYILGFNTLLNSAGTGEFRYEFYKNGLLYNGYIGQKPTANTWQTMEGTITTYLNAGDQIWIQYSAGSGATYIDCNFNRFWGRLGG